MTPLFNSLHNWPILSSLGIGKCDNAGLNYSECLFVCFANVFMLVVKKNQNKSGFEFANGKLLAEGKDVSKGSTLVSLQEKRERMTT